MRLYDGILDLSDGTYNLRRALVELTRVFGNRDFKQTELMFGGLHRLLESPKTAIRETVLIIVGKVGR